jgi:hypothetical protein
VTLNSCEEAASFTISADVAGEDEPYVDPEFCPADLSRFVESVKAMSDSIKRTGQISRLPAELAGLEQTKLHTPAFLESARKSLSDRL